MAKGLYPLKVSDIRRETKDCVSVAFAIPEHLTQTFAFTQGQYITLESEINNEKVRRSYSICASPLDNELRVAIKKVEGGKYSTFANETLKVGDTVEVMPPLGKFYTPLDAHSEKHYVAFAAGSGITPVMSILKTTLEKEPKSRFTLFYGNKFFSSVIFKEQLDDIKDAYLDRLNIHHVMSRENTDSEVFNGRLNGEKCQLFSRLLFNPQDVDEYFICGPEPMILDVRDTLLELEVEKSKIHVELFSSPGSQKQKKEKKKNTGKPEDKNQVTVIVDGNSFELQLGEDDDNILDAAMEAGADVPYACKGGVCCTCRAKVIEGEVEMDINYALEEDEVEKGFILTCQAHPKTKKVVVDYDVL